MPEASTRAHPIRALLIRNPIARHALREDTLAAVLRVAHDAAWEIDVVATDAEGHATDIARDAAARGVDVVVVHGGDGTLNEALNGLAGTETALAALRGGTANVWAKETRCAKDPVTAMHAIVTGRRRRVDLGRAGDRYFLLMAGVGLDAAIVSHVNPRLKRRIGSAAYIIAGAVAVFRTKARPSQVTIDGATHDTTLYWLLLGNTRSYGGVTNILHTAQVDDGLLEVALMKRGGAWHVLLDGVRALFHRLPGSRNVVTTRARAIDVTTPGLAVQIDGEAHGETPMRFEVVPDALTVIVANDLRTPLFSRE